MTIKFEGIPSSDYESFCWDVDWDTYVRIKTEVYKTWGKTDEEIQELFDIKIKHFKSCFHDGLYRLYPDEVILGKVNKKVLSQIVEITTNCIE